MCRGEVVELGPFRLPNQPEEPYRPGQFFIHRLLGYRGVIVIPWRARLQTYNPIELAQLAGADIDTTGRLRNVEDSVSSSGHFYQVPQTRLRPPNRPPPLAWEGRQAAHGSEREAGKGRVCVCAVHSATTRTCALPLPGRSFATIATLWTACARALALKLGFMHPVAL
jgi:hypothetical protein